MILYTYLRLLEVFGGKIRYAISDSWDLGGGRQENLFLSNTF